MQNLFRLIYPGGMPMPGRVLNSPEYRFGYQGQEKDSEFKGEGNSLNYTYRMQDTRLNRFLSVDPLAHEFPWQSPYCAFDNNPINKIDPDGRAAVDPGKTYDEISGEMIHDDGIDDKKVYTGTKSDGSDRVYRGRSNEMKDLTQKFNTQLSNTKSFFSKQNAQFTEDESRIGAGWIGKAANRLSYFKSQVTDGAAYDIKAPGKGYSPGEIGEYSFYKGRLMRFDNYGNVNYGAAAKAFGVSENMALFGAGLNQASKIFTSTDVQIQCYKLSLPTLDFGYIKSSWYPSNVSGFSDDPRDSYMISFGYGK